MLPMTPACWEEVAKLATTLLDITGIAPTTMQAKNLYNSPHAFDNKAIEVCLRLQIPLSGRFKCAVRSETKRHGPTELRRLFHLWCNVIRILLKASL